jgi:hypothetical protein
VAKLSFVRLSNRDAEDLLDNRLLHCCPLEPSEEDFTLVVSLNEYILRGDAVGTSCTYVDSRV